MKNYIWLMRGLYLFWMLFFSCLRILFISFQLFFGYKIKFEEFARALWYGAYMDLSMAAYFMILPVLVFFVNKWIPFNKILRCYITFLIAIVSIIHAGDNVLYREWGFRLDKSAFAYLTEFREAASFVSIGNALTMLILVILNVSIGIYLFKKISSDFSVENNYRVYLTNILLLPLLIIPIRGGLDIIPMNPGKVYFSSNPFPNHIALNVPWNIMYSALQNNNTNPDLHFMEDAKASLILDSLFENKNTEVDTILKTQRPKLLFIVLESFTAKLIHKKKEDIEITPRLNEWLGNGIYFSSAFASGDRTEIGMAALFSGFPGQPQSAIVHYPKKTEHIPSLIRTLKKIGYNSALYYGGDASFADMNSYFFNTACDVIVDKHEFPTSSYNAKWGVHDHILFEKIYDEIKNDTSQFLKICLSLSSHPPYDIPEEPTWKNTDEEVLFLNTAHYTDKHLGKLLDKLSALPLWNDLLIVISADHGARFPGNDLYQVPQKFRIPIWIGGGAIKKSFAFDKVVSQNDIAATILYQMGLSNDDFIFSKNIFSKKYKPFAYYAFNNGFGWVDEGGLQVYSNDKKEIILKEGNPQMDIETGKAYLQKVIQEFNRL